MVALLVTKIRGLKNKKLVGVGVCAVILGAVFILYRFRQIEPVSPGDNTVISPPVVKLSPELTLVEAVPAEGRREDIDAFSKTSFKFSASLLPGTIRVAVTPNIEVTTAVYEAMPDVLVVSADAVPWSSGVSYTITIRSGLRGSAGEELRSDVIYIFSNMPPESIDYNPI